jgi:MFS family permease
VLLPFAQRLPDKSGLNGTSVYTLLSPENQLKNYSNTSEIAEILKNNNKLFPAFCVFVFLDVLGLPAIAISSVALFTKMVHYRHQGLGQGIQRGVLGISTICGPLFAGPFIHNTIVLIGFTFVFLFLLLILLIFTHTHLKPVEQHKKIALSDEE